MNAPTSAALGNWWDKLFEKNSQFALKVSPFVGWSCSSGRPYICEYLEYMGSTNWSWQVKTKSKIKNLVGGEELGGSRVTLGE